MDDLNNPFHFMTTEEYIDHSLEKERWTILSDSRFSNAMMDQEVYLGARYKTIYQVKNNIKQ